MRSGGGAGFPDGIETRGAASVQSVQLAQQAFITRVFGWMFLGLALTAGVAVYFASQQDMLRFFSDNPIVYFAAFGVQILLVIALSAGLNRMPAQLAVFAFAAFAALNGFTISVIIEVYTDASIAGAFGVSAGMFAAMATYGYVTKRDLTKLGALMFMGLIGFLLASIVNLFLASSTLYWVLTYAGVVIFLGLTAYDMQRIKAMGASGISGDEGRKGAILGALSLYLNFINLFLLMLRIMGSARG
ncbi:Bax inhibitor-1/YccA family protein [Thermoleophilia bacterium SCSIO 60948]|nr:Bax inhibitor-1/YccA family protein [Thermoleophilia bacterium SCSIO 60948]